MRQCQNGHMVCETCFKKLSPHPECGYCRNATFFRNMVNVIAYAAMSGGNPFHLSCEALYFNL